MSEVTTIVLIDPEQESTSALAGRLQMQGYTVVVCHDPADGARVSLADPPLAVVADLWMPSISGVQLCRLLKAEPATEHVAVILRGPESPKNRFWAERAGASNYVVKGRMGDLVRALGQAISASPASSRFFTNFAGQDIRERIASHLDAALFESALAAEIRGLGTCGAFDRLFDLFSQFVSRIVSYRWLALCTQMPPRIGLHTSPRARASAEAEVRAALNISGDPLLLLVEDEDAIEAQAGPAPVVWPIELGGVKLGELALSLPESENHRDESFISIIAREIAGPIRIATLVEESQRLATVDALTGLMNRRAFIATLEREMARSTRYGDDLSFVLLDIDHFKLINDQYGHSTGDMVLSVLGKTLIEQLRTSDIAARWGGEEFVLALPCTNEPNAAIAAHRLRHTIEQLSIVDGRGRRVPVTGSLGVALLQRGESLEALIDRADRAMYQAKSAGRNQVILASNAEPASIAAPREVTAA